MEFVYRRSYRGPVRLVILDWAGTTMDYGCYAPAVVFIEVYKRRGVEITMAQARRPMGLHKREHIKAIGQIEEVAEAWQRVHGRPITEQDIDEMFSDFQPLQLACLADYADLIPGTLETVAACASGASSSARPPATLPRRWRCSRPRRPGAAMCPIAACAPPRSLPGVRTRGW